MRALLYTSVNPEAFQGVGAHLPPALLRITDTSIIVLAVEKLAEEGVREVDIVLHDFPELIKQQLGDGSRWGVSINYHLSRRRDCPFNVARVIARHWKGEQVILGRAESLPGFSLDALKGHAPLLMIERCGQWSGWGIVEASSLIDVPSDMHWEDLPKQLNEDISQSIVEIQLSTASLEAWMASNRAALLGSDDHPWVPTTAQLAEQGVWVSTACDIDPSVEFHAPVFIGEGVQINAGCVIGPYAVVEGRCLIDRGTELKHSMVCHDSYLGEGLSLENSIVNRNLLINLANDTSIRVTDEFILSSLSPESQSRSLWQILERFIGALLLFVLSPLVLWQLLRKPLSAKFVTELPAENDEVTNKVLPWMMLDGGDSVPSRLPLRQQLPVLYHIMCGKAHFVGVSPRAPEEVSKLPSDWRNLYLHSKLGCLTLAHLHVEEPSQEDLYSSDAVYAAHASPWFDARTLGRYVGKLLRGS